jgi:hypothetical protein
MNTDTNAQTLKKIIKEELPGLMKRDRKIRQWIIQLSKEQITENTNKIESKMESRFDRILDELKRDREAQTAKWEEHAREWDEYNKKQDKKWEEQNRKWDEYNKKQDKKWEEQNRKWEEQNRKWDEYNKKQDKKWEEQNRKWEEQNRKWEENQEEIRKLYRAFKQKYDTGIGALGARWGLRSEASFRNALKGILEDVGLKVEHIDDYDEEGVVYGRPSSVELDIIIKNSRVMICELKSSMSKADMFNFYKKAKFYEDTYKRKGDRLIVISPMVDDNAREVARELRIKIYSYADEIQEEF